MLLTRYIPCLLLSDTGLVKTVNFKNPSYVGDPTNTIRIFNEKEVDELLFLDISASPEKKEPNYQLLKEIADECFMPLSYGGGITTLEQAQKIYSIGIEKVAINSSAHNNLKLITEISNIYGSQAVIGSIDIKKNWLGKYQVVSCSGKIKHNVELSQWIKSLEDAGVGEILITSVDKEGTWQGFDIDLIKQVTSVSKVPVIAHGGAGNVQHIKDAINLGGANAVALGSMVVYQKQGMGVLINFPHKDKLPR